MWGAGCLRLGKRCFKDVRRSHLYLFLLSSPRLPDQRGASPKRSRITKKAGNPQWEWNSSCCWEDKGLFHEMCFPDSTWALDFPGGASGKESACQCRRHREKGLIPGSGRSPGGGHGNPLQYSCLENPMDRGAWRATAHGVAESQTRISPAQTQNLNSA